MKEKIKLIMSIMLIGSMLVLSMFRWQEGRYSEAVVGVLYSICNVIIFIL